MSRETMKNTSRVPSAASTSSASTATSEHPHVLPHGLRSQFGQLLPKHALFNVHVNIDQLSNVPLMSGQFAVRWKFKNVQSRSGLLSKIKGNHSWSDRGKGKGKGRASNLGLAIEVTPAEGEGEGDADEDDDDVDADSLSSARDEGTEDEAYPPNVHANPSLDDLQAEPETAVPPVTPTPATIQKAPSTSSIETRSVARGSTPWMPLQSYNVKWDQPVNVQVQMDVHRETGELLANELKLVVMQRVIPGDPDSPRQPRLGAVYLNLAEYADAGPVTRRYLLRESKTNATLKLTIELEFAGGEKHYHAPPLQKGEILASVTGLLSNNDLLRTSIARELDHYTHQDTEGAHPFLRDDGSVDVERLATSQGLRSTEDLIETLFNPVATASPSPSPFTYYAPPPAPPPSQPGDAGSTDTSSDSLSLANGSVRSSSSEGVNVSVEKLPVESSANLSTLNGRQEEEGGHKTWWRKIRSRPSTPANRQFKHTLPSPPLPPRETDAVHA